MALLKKKKKKKIQLLALSHVKLFNFCDLWTIGWCPTCVLLQLLIPPPPIYSNDYKLWR